MLRPLCFALCLLSLVACGGPSNRAPVHPSQSPGTQSGETRQINIANREEVEANIRDLLGQANAQFAPGGGAIPGFADILATIQPGTDLQSPVELKAGTPYSFFGVCDVDCSNVDLELLNGTTGEVVGADLLNDDYPVVNFTPQADARFFVRVILRSCTQSPCYVGARGQKLAAS